MKTNKQKTVDYSKPVEPIIIGDNVIVGYRNVKEKPNKQKTDWRNNAIKVAINDYGNETSVTTVKYIKQSIDKEERDRQWLESAEKLYSFISQLLKTQREEIISETRKDLENEYDNGFEDGCEQVEKEVTQDLLLEIESKCIFVKAYENGPALADSLIITYDDWLEIKSGRKSKISYKSIKQNETNK